MHKLSHPHVLRFYDWYETRHNLWLILEYCTGGDLESILKQDGHLPETSIRIFGVDIVAGMKVSAGDACCGCETLTDFGVSTSAVSSFVGIYSLRSAPTEFLNR